MVEKKCIQGSRLSGFTKCKTYEIIEEELMSFKFKNDNGDIIWVRDYYFEK